MEIRKNQDYIIDIIDVGSIGEGIGKIDNFTIFVDNTVVGDKVKIKIVKLKKSYGYGKLLEIIESSKYRIDPKCSYFNKCGGCQLQTYKYEAQLEFKQKNVKNSLERIGGLKNINIMPIIEMKSPWNYRNKAQFPVGFEDNQIKIGFYSLRSHNIISIDDCYINHKINNQILKIIKEFIKEYNIKPYNEIEHTGSIRYIFTRIGFKTNELMVCIVSNGKFSYTKELVKKLLVLDNIKCIAINYNTTKNNVILGAKTELLWGTPYICEFIGDIKFKISPTSFFQVNPIQTEILYNKILELSELSGSETVLDAYCGIGTISLFLAKKAKEVYGVEIVESAIDNARINATLNNITNVNFFLGKAEIIIPELILNNKIKPDIIIVDPPRKGCDEKLLDSILYAQPQKLIYVSCNPSTLARDLKVLNSKYKIEVVQPIDMFPNTVHVETVVMLSHKKTA